MESASSTTGRHARRFLTASFTMVAAFLAVASIAYGCTYFQGKLTVTPNGTGSSGTATASGTGLNMAYCSGPTSNAQLKRGNTVTATLGLSACGTSPYQYLDTATYTFTWASGGSTVDCMYMSTHQVGTVAYTWGNTTSKTTSAFSPPLGSFQFCAWNSANAEGNQVPLTAV